MRTFRAFPFALIAATTFAITASAQSASQAGAATPALPFSIVIDSVTKLTRAAQWEGAQRFGRANFGSAKSTDEKCALQIQGLLASTRLGTYDNSQRALKAMDVDCANTPEYRSEQLGALRTELTLPALPRTGVDFSALDPFWRVADKLTADVEPSEDDWRAMMMTVGYRLSMQLVPTTRTDLEVALRPSRRGDFDSLSKKDNDLAFRLVHLRAVTSRRAMLAVCRDSIARALPIQNAVALAAKFLPPHGTEKIAPPLVGFAYFRDDAYSLGPEGVIIDLEHICVEGGLTLLLAHEFHHSYLSTLSDIAAPATGDADAGVVYALMAMRNEGIADLIDKPYPLSYPNSPLMTRYATRYNEAYARTPQVMHSIDSALSVAAGDSTKFPEVGTRLRELLPSSGHYNGSYVAREIYETFGADSLYPGVRNQFAFLRTFAAAEKKRRQPSALLAKVSSALGQPRTKISPEVVATTGARPQQPDCETLRI